METSSLSGELLEVLRETKSNNKKSLILYSRRGNARAWVCTDCGNYEKCPHCDIAFAYHTSPNKHLLCHQCSTKAPFPIICPQCHGHQIDSVGVGIQQIEEQLETCLGKDISILRIDSDVKEKKTALYDAIGEHDIILGTNVNSTIVHPDIATVVWVLFELNLSIPSYHMEEDIYHEITYYKKQGLPLYIQTYMPEHPLLREIMDGNIKSFISYLSLERKKFNYPPFTEFATLRIHDENKKKVENIMRMMINKIAIIKRPSTFFAFDQDMYERYAGEWQQKIVLKDKDLSYLIDTLEVEIVRNRNITLEWD